jgi:hypothetical protein
MLFSALQAVLKFCAAVVHVSVMNFPDEMETSILNCCLADGKIAAFSTEDVLKKTALVNVDKGHVTPIITACTQLNLDCIIDCVVN